MIPPKIYGSEHPVEIHPVGQYRNDLRSAGQLRRKKDDGNKYDQREDHRNDEWHEPEIILGDDLGRRKS